MKRAVEKIKEKFEIIGNYKYYGVNPEDRGFSYRLVPPTDDELAAILKEAVTEISELELMKILEKKL